MTLEPWKRISPSTRKSGPLHRKESAEKLWKRIAGFYHDDSTAGARTRYTKSSFCMEEIEIRPFKRLGYRDAGWLRPRVESHLPSWSIRRRGSLTSLVNPETLHIVGESPSQQSMLL